MMLINKARLAAILLSAFTFSQHDIVHGAILEEVYRVGTPSLSSEGTSMNYRKSSKSKSKSNSLKSLSADTTCDSDVTILTMASEICDQTITGPGKFVIDAETIDCGSLPGPTLEAGAVLDCQGATIMGDYIPPQVDNRPTIDGIVMDGESVVENCIVSNFASEGIRTTATTGKKLVYNTIIQYSGTFGLVIDGDDDNEFINVVVKYTDGIGVVVRGTGDNEFRNSKFSYNTGTGFRSNPTVTGTTKIIDSEIIENGTNGLTLQAVGETIITGTIIAANAQDGVVRQINGAVPGPVTLNDVIVKDNLRWGVNIQSDVNAFTILGSVITGNFEYGVRVANGLGVISCTEIVENEMTGIITLGASTSLSIKDSSISENGTVNIDLNNGSITLSRVYACDGGTLDTEVTGPAASSTDLSATTCDFSTGPTCGFTCDECSVEVPAWCSMKKK